jgi:hypothetical protein
MASVMTNKELEAIGWRADVATPEPWESLTYECSCHEDGQDDNYVRGPRSTNGEVVMCERDADFVAHARSDVPALVKEVRRLQEMLAIALRPEG